MKIERHYYTEDKKRWEQAEAKMNARYDGMTEAELQAEMQFLTQSFGALSAECRAALAHVRQAPSQKKAEQFAVLRNQALCLAEYLYADLVAEDDDMRGVVRFEVDRIVINDMMDSLVLSTLGSLIVQADEAWLDAANGLLHLRLTYHLYDEVSE